MKANEPMEMILELHRKATVLEVVTGYLQTTTDKYIDKDTLLRIIGVDDFQKVLTDATTKLKNTETALKAIKISAQDLLTEDTYLMLIDRAELMDEEEVKEYGNRTGDSVESD